MVGCILKSDSRPSLLLRDSLISSGHSLHISIWMTNLHGCYCTGFFSCSFIIDFILMLLFQLSENVIDRMKESSPSGSRSQRHSGVYGASVSDEELKRRVAEELALEQAKKESETQKRLKQDKELERERAAASEQLTRAILRERVASEEERAKAKHLAKQLEEKDRVIKKQDAFYKEQLARLEERSSEFYKVTTEQYQKAAEEVEAKFKRYEYHPVCADLQARILQCYRQNTHQTLSCSALANQYMHCVNHAKQCGLQVVRDV
uniref:Coiled-coil-helix-coiled-coil-helix domain containing 3 n=1 Tax=Oryctolagus cuniculus TaxID=9986 RepID=A0A5F9CFC5_RABIT